MSFRSVGISKVTVTLPSLPLTAVAPPKDSAVLSPLVPQLTSCRLQTNNYNLKTYKHKRSVYSRRMAEITSTESY
jgi:hypothetical protein